MDWYTLAKFLHVSLAVVWLGGGFILVLLGILAARANNRADLFSAIRMVTIIAPKVFIPGSLAVLVLGLVMVWLGGWAWEAWLVIGLAGFVLAAGIGVVKLGPASDETARLVADGKPAEAEAMARKMLRFAKIEYVIQAAIIFAMVAKPSWGEISTLASMAAVGALALVAILLAPKQVGSMS